MESLKLTFGTMGSTQLSISSVQNCYDTKYLLPIVIEENGPYEYIVNIFDANHLESVFPFFKVTETSFFKFQHNDKLSPCLKIHNGGQISSFPVDDKVYGLEILNENKQTKFEKAGGHQQKKLIVWFGVDEGYDECGIYNMRKTETDGYNDLTDDLIATDGYSKLINRTDDSDDSDYDEIDGYKPIATDDDYKPLKLATIALNNTSMDKFQSKYFKEPKKMNKRTFIFCFKKFDKMMNNLYIN